MGDVDNRLAVTDFRRVDRGIEEIEGDTFIGQCLGVGLRHASWVCEPAVDCD